MAARVQIVVEAKDATSGVFRAITSELGAFGGLMEELTAKNISWGNVGQMAAKMVIDGVKDAIKVTTEYAQEVRDLSLASGQSAEESSRMLQVLDDYQLTADDAKTATRALTKEGLAPTIDTIIDLSAEFQNLTSVEERNAFVQKNLGRAGQEWLNLLSQGPEKIKAMNAAVSENLILTEDNVRASEEYRLALDNWGDAIDGVKIKLGNQLLPVMTEAIKTVDDHTRALEIMEEQGMSTYHAVGSVGYVAALNAAIAEREAAEATEQHSAAMATAEQSATELAAAEKAAAAAAKEMDAANRSFVGTLQNVASARETFNQGMAETDAAFAAGDISIDEHAAKMGELKATYQETINSMVLGLVQFQLASDGAFDDADLNKYLAAGQKLGVFTQGMVTDTKRLYNEAMNLSTGLDAVKDPMLHVGARAEDNAEHFGLMAESGAELGESLRKEVAAGAAAATSALVSIPTSINVDIWIRTHGGGNFLSQFANTTTTNSAIEDMRDDSGGGRQMGGEVFAGMPYNVGEGGMETFVPNANGRIVGHKAALHQAGLMGGGSQRNIFYGPVTLQIGEDSAAGFMSLR
jgi:superoxide dismutase